MPGPISQVKRGEIIAYYNAGTTAMDIARLCNISKSTVYRIIKKNEIEGYVIPGPYLGAQRCMTREEDDIIVNTINQNGFQSSKKIKADTGLECSIFTIRRRLNEAGYFHHIPAQKELLTERHKEQRMAFALEHLGWMDEWMTTIFSDEKVFSTDESGRVILWRMRGTRYAEENVRFRRRSGHITLGFWGCMTLHGPGP